MQYDIPYGRSRITFEVPESAVAFRGEMARLPGLPDLRAALIRAMEDPIGAPPFRDLARGKKNIVFLVEDATRHTPLAQIMPVVIDHLNRNGVPDDAISFLTAPGTHRVMTEREIEGKIGPDMVRRFRVRQHDATRSEDIVDLGTVMAGDYQIPVHISRYALEADLLIGLGSIVPHSDAGFSGGAKILQPGVCDFVTTAATHAAAGLCPDIPLGIVDNPCRQGIEAVGHRVGNFFILNVVQNCDGEIAGVFAGDFVQAHRSGVELSRQSFRVDVPERANIVVVSSSPADLDYWQASKGIISSYFAVREGGTIVFAAPCTEGLAHNHPRFREWLSLPLDETLRRLRAASPADTDADLVSAVLAIDNCRVRNRAKIFCVHSGLTDEDLAALRYVPFASVQEALDEAFRLKPDATVGILPKGGVSLPVTRKAAAPKRPDVSKSTRKES